MIDCYIHTSADIFHPSWILFVKPSNCNVNLNQTLYSFAEGSVTPVNNINISDSILWVLYLLSEIIITPLCCLIIISVHSKIHIFIYLTFNRSSGVNQNNILSIFKSGWLNFLQKFLKIIHFSIGLQFWLSIAP